MGVLIVSRALKEVTEEVILSGTEGPAVEHQGTLEEAQELGEALEQGCPRPGRGDTISLEVGEFSLYLLKEGASSNNHVKTTVI